MADLVETPARIEPCLVKESSEEIADLTADLAAASHCAYASGRDYDKEFYVLRILV